ncbi:DUF6268 family outer membrane beta-barrel protein [Marivirga arenosa]|uniref:DUF6268 family outer membrane beta-barrel protein n=1 Tax=Marivirga arenosa TaxID=3059076 RepID=A0AA49JCV4_9BACT|nr:MULTISPECIES: DUF6268 family outer membrane beta-barrel protein [unclassified Marivirga]WKK80682.1 DUF6268 family outer membrane beta-barrel protein [Marivirga sp. BKB1-2]WKK84339.2 DUF6268 family outer membrane beta-barrel protein [Marivirga sp. ABR2-2]
MKNYILLFFLLLSTNMIMGQDGDDDFDDFDPSMFEEAGSSLKVFCTNKTLGQSPTQLVSFGLDYHGPSTLTTPAIGDVAEEEAEWSQASGFRFNSNVPLLSKNNILINWSFNYVQFGFNSGNDVIYQNPLNATLSDYSLKWLNTNFTLFKPLNEKSFLLAQLGVELNGDYSFDNPPSLSNTRVPAALIYGFKPNDNLMWGAGVSRTYLGGALNVLPVVYYYKTFKNEKWGIEALLPARLQARYRMNSRNLLLMGYYVEGATYNLSNFGNYQAASTITNNSVELRRSEIRAGLTYSRGLNDFIWVSGQAGYRVNYSFELDEGEFYRGFNGDDYLQENSLSNTWYIQFSLSLVSP